MEVENDPLEDYFPLQTGGFSLPFSESECNEIGEDQNAIGEKPRE